MEVDKATGQIQGRNIRNYSNYLNERARTYGDVRTDYVRDGEGKLRKLSVDKGLLREVESVQMQIKALLKCTVRLSLWSIRKAFVDSGICSSWTTKWIMKSHFLHFDCWYQIFWSCSMS